MASVWFSCSELTFSREGGMPQTMLPHCSEGWVCSGPSRPTFQMCEHVGVLPDCVTRTVVPARRNSRGNASPTNWQVGLFMFNFPRVMTFLKKVIHFCEKDKTSL